MTIAFGSEITSAGVSVDANSRLLHVLGFEPEDVVGRSAVYLGIWADPWLRAALIQRVREEGSLRDMELPWHTSSGSLTGTSTSWEMGRLGIKTPAELIRYTLRRGFTDSGWSEESA